MGQKVHPNGIRLGIVKEHTSVWYADKRTYADYLLAVSIFIARLKPHASPSTPLVPVS